MKIQFESQLEYQNHAINSIVNIFEGQEICQSNFTVTGINDNLLTYQNDLGIGNRLELLDDEILSNVQQIQLKNGLPQTKGVKDIKTMDFSVEMETGTGKTYVYLKTIFEMNKKFGFTKFIIVVPSIAIKEGTNKTLEITNEHFKGLFDNVNYDYFVYDSSNLEQVRDFATSSDIRVMIINIDAFKKSFTDPTKDNKANLIHRTNDRLNGMKPIDFIASTNPIVIIDEPQSVDNTSKSKEAISTLNPLCKLRYSATHTEKHNLMYKLDSIDAYEQKLVKQIEVANVRTTDNQNQAYIKLLKVSKKPITATVEIDVNEKGITKRVSKTIKDGTILYDLTKRDVYMDFNVNDIYVEEGNEYIQFSNGQFIKIGESIGDVDEDSIKRLQIRKTIEEHLDKEMKLNPMGIKVLSLFFIDRVANYRYYDEESNTMKGKYAVWFEEEYQKIIKYPKYHSLFEKHNHLNTPIEKIHDGYFSQDKKGQFKDSNESTSGELKSNADDEDTFNRIMKNKEKLLSFEDNLRFIFSHSALKEGWDNPNVFQICTLKEGSKSEIRRRQEIGRGLRICVNQDGERVYGFDVNTLTVMANESYEDFAIGLQREIEKEEGIKFGVIEKHEFSNITRKNENGEIVYLGAKESEKLYDYLHQKEYIDSKGKVQDSLKNELRDGSFSVPLEFEQAKTQIINVIKKIAGNLNIKNADDKVVVKVKNSNSDVVKQTTLSSSYGDLKGVLDSLSNGTYTIEVTATDEAGNSITKTQAITISSAVADTVKPTVEITDNVDGTARGDVTYTITFSEAVSGFDVSDVSVTNGTKGTFTQVNAYTYTLVVTPTASTIGDITVQVAKDIAQDASGNNNTASNVSTQAYDTATEAIAPTLVLGSKAVSSDSKSAGSFAYSYAATDASGIESVTAKIKTNPQIHQELKLFIINEIAPITALPNSKNKIPVFIVSFINKAGVMFENPYFLFSLKVEYNSNGKDKTQLITIKLSTKIIAFNQYESI